MSCSVSSGLLAHRANIYMPRLCRAPKTQLVLFLRRSVLRAMSAVTRHSLLAFLIMCSTFSPVGPSALLTELACGLASFDDEFKAMAGDCGPAPMQEFSDFNRLLRIMLEPHLCHTTLLNRHLGERTWHRFGRHGANAKLFARRMVPPSVATVHSEASCA